MSISKREMFLLCVLLICGLAYAYYTYGYEPLQKQIAVVRTENQKLSQEIEQLKKVEPSQEGESTDALLKIKQDFYAAAAKVPTFPLVPESITFLESCSRDAVIDLKSLQISDPGSAQPVANAGNSAANSGMITQTYELAGTGGYFALNSFLMKLEEAPRVYVISSIDIGSQPLAVSTAPQTVQASPAPTATTATSATRTYDGNSLTFTMSVTSFYDNIDLENIGTSFETVQPTAGRNNPFSS